jgi:lysophospholipase L1-like esterase
MNLVTLSIGGNDVGFSSILIACVFNPLGSCTTNIANARTTMYQGTLYDNYFAMINLMITDLNWCPPGGTGRSRTEDCFTILYQTAYPSFFESYTPQCNKVKFFPFVGNYVTQSLRADLNQLGQELNALLAYYVANINQQMRGDRETFADFMVFADQGERFAGHRFCRADVTEPDLNNVDTWFFNYGSNADTATTVFGASLATGPASDYTATDPNSCATTNDMGDQLSCAISQMVSAGTLPGSDQVIAYTAPEDRTKTFHPNTNGFGAVSAEVQQRLGYVSAITEGRGCPSANNLNLRIVGIGDSITWGYRSDSGGGYFYPLNDDLGSAEAQGCAGNTWSFIGSQVSGAFRSEGYPGQTVSQIQASVQASGTLAERPNMILLMAGTNDINQGADPLATAETLSTTIDYLFAQCPDAVILVQHIPPIGYQEFERIMSAVMQNVTIYNAAISAMVDTRIAQGQHISKVYGTTTTFDHYVEDTLHPNDIGYDLIGDAWLERITVVDQLGWINPPDIVSGTKIQCASGLWWDPQGQVATGAGLGANLYLGITCTD